MHVRYVEPDACRDCEGERATHARRAHPYAEPTKAQRVIRLQTRMILAGVRAYRLGEDTAWAILLETDVFGGADRRLREQVDTILLRNGRPTLCEHVGYRDHMAENDTKSNGPLVIGRVVHYRTCGSADPGRYPPTCVPADVTEHDRTLSLVGLLVKNPRGLFFKSLAEGGISYDGRRTPEAETWHWPTECPDGR